MTLLPDLDVAAGRVLWCLKHSGPRRAKEIPLYALGVTQEHIDVILARLEANGQARRDGQVWSAVA